MNQHRLPRPDAGALGDVVMILSQRFGARASINDSLRDQHSHGEGLPTIGKPDIVVFPESNEEVAFILSTCNDRRVPVVPFGAGSSLEGQLAALAGGVSVDMQRFDKVLDVNPDSMDCRVGAGVTREALNAHIRDTGLFFPVDPGANASIGGMAATRASGTNAVRYGTMRENILGLTVVTPDGHIIRTGSRARKSSAGLDLTHLYVGSEGTLGIITEVQLKLYGVPESIVAATCQFDDLDSAVGAVVASLQAGLKLARIELLDEVQVKICNAYSSLGLPETPHLFLEFVGSKSGTDEDVAFMKAIVADHGSGDFQFAERLEDRNRLWKARHNCYYACMAYAPGLKNMGTDACVPISALPQVLLETREDARRSGLITPIVGHVGDGNFHLGIMFDENDPDQVEKAEGMAFRVARRAIAAGGTCSGEHGIGVHKIVHLEAEHGYGAEIMKQIKRTLDPNGIMNPGKFYTP
ncbi:MAG TPA: FAD-linked oxidase C-terminal domain-containing protein [Beijerinckiaceae bacterium]|nr:FAD-linked oxidase C-terminal domain-containing protein [Beijerinckiaceae bacterium]